MRAGTVIYDPTLAQGHPHLPLCSLHKSHLSTMSDQSKLESMSEMSFAHKLETIFWGKPPKDPKERKLLIKLDVTILSYVCLNCESPFSV